ncbi:MAG: SUMF1/EgtB/PvdO family nonheme iron enzyme [Phycisphaerae bacterium]|nr:SUMF1/EgtB/PvdO family nonheme iron enzyme [Phycisphaerae bacterium]
MNFPQFAAAVCCVATATVAVAVALDAPLQDKGTLGTQAGAGTPVNPAPPTAGRAVSFKQAVPGTAIEFEMVEIPARDGVKSFHIGRTEVPWELFDVYVYQLDKPSEASGEGSGGAPSNSAPSGSAPPDAVARPTKPYISMDRGFGHAGWPAISMSAHNAKQFCAWLSAKTGRAYRLPTQFEWMAAAAHASIAPDRVMEHAWVAENADAATHKLGTRKADAAGLHDLYGNAAEWVVDASGNAVVIGGSYRDAAAAAGPARVQPDNPDWNASDPQFPKSVWWLADGGFIGLRLVCDAPAPPAPPAPPASPAPKVPTVPRVPSAAP